MRDIQRTLMSAVVFLFMTWSNVPCAFAQDIGEHESRKAEIERDIRLLDGQLRSTEKRGRDASANLGLIRKKIEKRKELIKESERMIAGYDAGIAKKEREIKMLKDRFDTLSVHYAALVKGVYKNRDTKVWYLYILASENTAQAFRRIGYFKNITNQINSQADRLLKTGRQMEMEKEKLGKLRENAEKERQSRVEALNTLKEDEKDAGDLVKKMRRNSSKYKRALQRKHREIEKINREIERIIREAAEQARKEAESSGENSAGNGSVGKHMPIDYKLDARFAKNKGKLPWPAKGPVVESFGRRYHPVFKNIKMPRSNGITIALEPNSGAAAIFDGVVKQIVVIPGYSKCILVQHGNYFSFYCKMMTVNVKTGDKVKTGQNLGIVDTIDGVTGLHFEIWKGSTPNDPMLWLRP